MSITRKRAGRKSWATRQRFEQTVENFFESLAAKKWKFEAEATAPMRIERKSATGNRVISFSQAYGEISARMDASFANISEDGLSDMLTETFFQKARIALASVEYRLIEAESG